MNPKQDTALPTPRADHQELEVGAPDAECMDSANRAPMCSGGKPWGGQEASCIASRTPSPVAPFCVDISLQTFRSLLDLVLGIRRMMSPVPATPARIPDKADSSTVPDGRPTCKAQAATEAIGPESCEEPATGSPAQTKPQHGAPAPNVDGFAIAPRSVRMEVLRGTLKLLKVNLFHLARIAAMRRACRENCVVNHSREIRGKPSSNENHAGSKRETKPAEKEVLTGGVVDGSKRLQSRGSRTGDGANDANRDNQISPSVKQGVKFETLGQKRCLGVGERDQDMHGVIQELHAELRTVLEDTSADTHPETINAALAVHVRSVTCCYPSNAFTHSLLCCMKPRPIERVRITKSPTFCRTPQQT